MRINGETWLLCFLGLMVGSTVLIVVPKIVDQRVRPTEFLDLSLDPPVGSPMPMSVVTATLDAHGRLLPNSLGRIMLVSGGSCSGCSKGAIQFDKLPYQDFDAVYVLYNEPSDKIRQAFPPPPEETSTCLRILLAPRISSMQHG